MKENTVRMSEVVGRHNPDFIIEYELEDNIQLRHFPGCILNFSYDVNPAFRMVHCDIFPEFRKSSKSREVVGLNEIIPVKGIADMWIVSERNRLAHQNAIQKGRNCYLMKGNQIIAKCTIKKVTGNFETTRSTEVSCS